MKKLIVHTDGSARPTNPGPAGAGFVITTESGMVTIRGTAPLGWRTNNEAEYEAVVRALRVVHLFRWKNDVVIYTDSKLVVNQLQGKWRITKPSLVELRDSILRLVGGLPGIVTFEWCPREENAEADELSKLGSADAAAGKKEMSESMMFASAEDMAAATSGKEQ